MPPPLYGIYIYGIYSSFVILIILQALRRSHCCLSEVGKIQWSLPTMHLYIFFSDRETLIFGGFPHGTIDSHVSLANIQKYRITVILLLSIKFAIHFVPFLWTFDCPRWSLWLSRCFKSWLRTDFSEPHPVKRCPQPCSTETSNTKSFMMDIPWPTPFQDDDFRLKMGGLVVVASNAGGAWTPIGDITTTMLYIGGQVPLVMWYCRVPVRGLYEFYLCVA